MTDIPVAPHAPMTHFGTIGLTLLAAAALLLGAAGCSDKDVETVNVTLRADAVEPAEPVDVTYSLDGGEPTRTGARPGEELDLGSVDVGTAIHFAVTNSHDAGHVRANILIDDCFRASTSCSQPGCVATADYTAAVGDCLN